MRSIAAAAAGLIVLAACLEPVEAYPLTLEQRERLKRYLPRTFTRLEAKDPVHVTLLGDELASGYTPVESAWEQENSLFTYPGIFLSLMAREFFYPASVRLLNPPEGGTEKLTEYLGNEIRFENLATRGGTAYDGLRRAMSDAFLHGPDLLLINFGVHDARERIGLDSYKRALQLIIESARQKQIDVIVMAPSWTNEGAGAMQWGITRRYAMAARQIAGANGVMFLDPGRHLVRWGGGIDPDTHPVAAMEIVGDRMKRIFYYGEDGLRPEILVPGPDAQRFLGQSLFDELLDGPRESDFSFAGVAVHGTEGKIRVAVSIRNQSRDRKQGTIGALAVGEGLVPNDPAKRFEVGPGESARVEFTYERPEIGEAGDGEVRYFPLELDDEVTRFPFVLEDTFESELVDLPLRIGPVSISWRAKQFINVTNRMRAEWRMRNGTSEAVTGTYQVGFGKAASDPVSFSLPPLGDKDFEAIFPFEPREESEPFYDELWVQVTVGKMTYRFRRTLEASRDIALGEEIPLRRREATAPPSAGGNPGGAPAYARFEADENFLYAIARVGDLAIPDRGDVAALRFSLTVDGRSSSEVRSFGSVAPLEFYFRANGGLGSLAALPIGCFGSGYDRALSAEGLKGFYRVEGDQREVIIAVPRSYLYRHEWKMEDALSLLGVRLELSVADPESGPGTFEARETIMSHAPALVWNGRIVSRLDPRDARSLATLRLSRQPVRSWSIRVF